MASDPARLLVRPHRPTRSRDDLSGFRVAGLPATAMLVACLASSLAGQEPSAALPALPVDTFRLDNGLRVVVSADPQVSVAAVSVWYHVGRAHEEKGGRGVAELVRRLVGSGSAASGTGLPEGSVPGAGGSSGSATGPDRTAFVEVVPSHRLEVALQVQAARMAPLRISAEVLEGVRWAVEEERRGAVRGLPYRGALLALDTLGPEPGRRSALELPAVGGAVGPADVEAFHRRFYVPSNAVLTVVGNVDVPEVRRMVERHFGGRAPGRPASGAFTAEPAPGPAGERRLELTDAGAPLPAVWMAYPLPPSNHPDRHALELLAIVLGPGPGSRLGRRLGDPDGAATALDVRVDTRRGPGALRIGVVAAEGRGIEELEGLVDGEIERLRRDGVATDELERALRRHRARWVAGLLGVRGRASALQWHALHQGSATAVNDEAARYEAVTADDIRRVARTRFTRESRTVVIVRPGGGGAE